MSDMSRLPSVAEYWDAEADAFDEDADHGLRDLDVRAAWRKRLQAWLPAPPDDILDLGCGTGSLSLLMSEAGHRVVGVDLSPRMIAAARAKCAGRDAAFLVGDAVAPAVGKGRFAAVVVRHLVWTLPDPHAALRRWVTLLRPGGRLVLVEGRWAGVGATAPYAQGTDRMPWAGGASAHALVEALEPYVATLSVEDLSSDPRLWGRQVSDVRYVVLASR